MLDHLELRPSKAPAAAMAATAEALELLTAAVSATAVLSELWGAASAVGAAATMRAAAISAGLRRSRARDRQSSDARGKE
jgi:hypothetical protein